jgi:hypothetical protein
MIELALLAGLGTLGYVLASQSPSKKTEDFETTQYIPPDSDSVVFVDPNHKGHSNQVPYFGANVTQSMYSGATDTILDAHTGAGKEYFQKREVKSFYDAKPGSGLPFRNQVETEFEQSRMVSSQRLNNVFPIEQVRVGPGGNDGYTNIPKGGYQQDQYREYALPKTTDEVRVESKPKLSYEPPVIRGQNIVTQPGLQADVSKNRPDRYVLLGMDRANTSVGAQTASRIYPGQPMKEQSRETTTVDYNGPARGNAIFASYIRAFTEPFEEFMKLTTEGRPGPAGTGGGIGIGVGAEMYSAQTKKDEGILADATRFNVPQNIVTSGLEHLGSYRYKEPLQEDIYTSRNNPSVVSALKSNPYAKSLSSF